MRSHGKYHTKTAPLQRPRRLRLTLNHDMNHNLLDPIRAFLITSDRLLFTGLQTALSQVMALTYGTGQDHRAIQQVMPQVIFLDVNFHGSVAALIPKARDIVPHAKILLLAGWTDMELIREVYLLGVEGIALKTQPPEVLLALVKSLISPIGGETMKPYESSMPKPYRAAWPTSLTPREQDIVQLVTQGLSNKEIADHLRVSPITVRHHLTSIFSKFGVANRQKLVIMAHQQGMMPPISLWE